MKKILLTLSIIVTALSFNTVFAQSVTKGPNLAPTSSEGVLVASTNIYNAKILSQEGRDFVLSFDISNSYGIQPGVEYAVRLTKVLSKGEVSADEHVYNDIFSLGQKTVNKEINYSIPQSLSAGTYRLFLESKNEGGLDLAGAYFGEVKVSDTISNTIEIVPGSCTITAGNEVNQMIPVGESDKLTAICSIENRFANNVSVIPTFETRSHSVFGGTVEQTGGSYKETVLKSGSNKVNFELPKATKSQDYNINFSLSSSDQKIKSNSVNYHYFLAGQSGTIQNAVFDKTFYSASSTASIKIFTTASASGSIQILVTNSSGINCSATTTEKVNNFSFVSLEIPITKNCINPRASVSLISNGNILDSKDFQVTTPKDELPTSNFSTIAIIVVIIILVILILLFYKRKHSTLKVFIFVFLALSSFLGFTKSASADAWAYTITLTQGNTGYVGGDQNVTFTFTVNLDKPSYNKTDSINVTRSISSGSWYCGNGKCPAITGSSQYGVIDTSSYIALNYPSATVFAPAAPGNHNFNVLNRVSASWGNFDWYQSIFFNVYNLDASPNIVSYFGTSSLSWAGVNSLSCTFSRDGVTLKTFSNEGWIYCSGEGGMCSFSGTKDVRYGAGTYPGVFWNFGNGTNGVACNNNSFGDPIQGTSKACYFYNSPGFVSQFSTKGGGPGQLYGPSKIAKDTSGNLYVTDYDYNTGIFRVQKFNSSGVFQSVIASTTGNTNSSTNASVAVDSSNNVYVVDEGNSRVIFTF